MQGGVDERIERIEGKLENEARKAGLKYARHDTQLDTDSGRLEQ